MSKPSIRAQIAEGKEGGTYRSEIRDEPLIADASDHAEKLSDLPDEHMADILPTLKKLAIATVSLLTQLLDIGYQLISQGAENYNILQVSRRRVWSSELGADTSRITADQLIKSV